MATSNTRSTAFVTWITFWQCTRTNEVYFRRLNQVRVQLPWLHKEIFRQWGSKQRSLCQKFTASTRWTALAVKEICRLWHSKKNVIYFRSIMLALVELFGLRKQFSECGTRANLVYFRKLLLALVELLGLHKEICWYRVSNLSSLFSKAHSSTF